MLHGCETRALYSKAAIVLMFEERLLTKISE
jgi:hypothetical protein